MARTRSDKNGTTRGGVAVLGLGRFGSALALELVEEGEEVLAADLNPRAVQEHAGRLTHVVEADTTSEDAMRGLGLGEFGTVVVSIGTDIEASILTASVAIHLGVRNVWAKAISEPHARILAQIGVHNVVRPEHDMGQRVAHLVRGRMLDYIEFDDGYVFVKTRPPALLHNRSLTGVGVRKTYGVTVVGVKPAGGTFTYTSAETVIRPDDHIIVSGPQDKVEAFARL
ncbi:TrkA family potassium uptake protein [Nocardioides sp.]|uniref:potassium channel family protein n=1 Tax=Nocardioides sp. TaxID=35761 RepID=UPI0025E598A1|nr:TrkA family potassium uptake protein [Nocardioides sp.]